MRSSELSFTQGVVTGRVDSTVLVSTTCAPCGLSGPLTPRIINADDEFRMRVFFSSAVRDITIRGSLVHTLYLTTNKSFSWMWRQHSYLMMRQTNMAIANKLLDRCNGQEIVTKARLRCRPTELKMTMFRYFFVLMWWERVEITLSWPLDDSRVPIQKRKYKLHASNLIYLTSLN